MSKDVGLRIRVESELRSRFVDACRAQDVTAAHVLRSFMRDFVNKHAGSGDTSDVAVMSLPRSISVGAIVEDRDGE